ncbi:MAG TPA: hypothetical protein VF483_01580 [Gemmatimonadaceae bacterium]
MLLFALLLQAQAVDSVYATPALRSFVARAAIENLAPPRELIGYRAAAETEFGFILRDSLGRESVGQIEQLAAQAQWDRGGRYDLHVVGYRAQSLGAPYSALTFTRMYTVPTLYGSRLAVGLNDNVPLSKTDSSFRRKVVHDDSVAGRTPFRAMHPLAPDRDRYYRFTGGDTVATITSAGRRIRVVRVNSDLTSDPAANFVGFKGELDFDADRFQLVRMRGRFVNVTSRKDPLFVRGTGAVAVAYVEFENAQVGGKYWLPTFQRSEFQAQMQLLGDVRPVYRIVTRFRDFTLDINDSLATLASADSTPTALPPTRAKLTFAPRDSVNGFGRWQENMGDKIGGVGSDDFNDLAPDVWKPTGAPTMSWWPKEPEDVVRYNRVEGLFTGMAGNMRFRDLVPGLTARGTIGVAWQERTARGLLSASLRRGLWITSGRVERSLAVTNDFLPPLESGLGIGPLISSVDETDYVDRRTAALSVTRIIHDVDRALLSAEVAYVGDRNEVARLTNGMLSLGVGFKPNRNALSGDYARSTVTLEIHPRVSGEGLSSGIGARVEATVAAGELSWQRVEAGLSARQYWHGFVFASHLDAGAVFGKVTPPQVLYELGGGDNLPSYKYKEFGGDRAALGRGLVAYHFPILRAPMRLGRIIIPGISPGLGAGVHGGWTGALSSAASTSLLALGGDGVTPLSAPSGRVRATVDFRVTILSGAIGAGMARPVDQSARWRPFFVWGAGF